MMNDIDVLSDKNYGTDDWVNRYRTYSKELHRAMDEYNQHCCPSCKYDGIESLYSYNYVHQYRRYMSPHKYIWVMGDNYDHISYCPMCGFELPQREDLVIEF